MKRLHWTLFLALGVAGSVGCGSDEGAGTNRGASGSGAGSSGGASSSGGSGATSGGSGASSGGSGASSASGGSSAVAGSQNAGGVPDQVCTKPEDCGDVSRFVCDPSTGKCAAGQCSPTLACGADKVCVPQVDDATVGACYAGCTPFSEECGADVECVSVSFDNTVGACYERGTATGACDDGDLTSTGCAMPGTLCIQGQCTGVCDVFTGQPGCAAGLHCDLSGYCRETAGDAAKVDESCAADAEALDRCGDEGAVWRGMCLPDLGGSEDALLRCYQLCREGGTDCAAGFDCVPLSTELPGVGACVSSCNAGGSGQDCDTCITSAMTACCAEPAAACEAGSPCDTLTTCLEPCELDDSACVQACADATPEGVDPYVALARCLVGDQEATIGACGLCQ